MATGTLSGVPQRRSSRAIISRPLDMALYAKAPVSVFNSNYASLMADTAPAAAAPPAAAPKAAAAPAAPVAPPAPAPTPAVGKRRSTRVPVSTATLDMSEYAKPTTPSVYAPHPRVTPSHEYRRPAPRAPAPAAPAAPAAKRQKLAENGETARSRGARGAERPLPRDRSGRGLRRRGGVVVPPARPRRPRPPPPSRPPTPPKTRRRRRRRPPTPPRPPLVDGLEDALVRVPVEALERTPSCPPEPALLALLRITRELASRAPA